METKIDFYDEETKIDFLQSEDSKRSFFTSDMEHWYSNYFINCCCLLTRCCTECSEL